MSTEQPLATILPSDIEWEGEHLSEFSEQLALAVLLHESVIFLNDHWRHESWPSEAKAVISLNVNCSDVFAWGCADAEEVPYRELSGLYHHWEKDAMWGPAVWCIKKRKARPQSPVEQRIRDAGIWDMDEIIKSLDATT